MHSLLPDKMSCIIIIISVTVFLVVALGIGLGVGLLKGTDDDSCSFNQECFNETTSMFDRMKGISPSLSGYSAGGYMSCLMHTIHSATFIGAAPIAGGIYASPYVRMEKKGRRKRDSDSDQYSI